MAFNLPQALRKWQSCDYDVLQQGNCLFLHSKLFLSSQCFLKLCNLSNQFSLGVTINLDPLESHGAVASAALCLMGFIIYFMASACPARVWSRPFIKISTRSTLRTVFSWVPSFSKLSLSVIPPEGTKVRATSAFWGNSPLWPARQAAWVSPLDKWS